MNKAINPIVGSNKKLKKVSVSCDSCKNQFIKLKKHSLKVIATKCFLKSCDFIAMPSLF